MWLEDTVSRLRSGESVPVAALMASTAVRALTRPLAVRTTTPPGRASIPAARLPSWIRAPRASSRSRSPKASRAGCTVALRGTNTPRAEHRRVAARPGLRGALRDHASSPSIASAAARSWAGAVDDEQLAAAAVPRVDAPRPRTTRRSRRPSRAAASAHARAGASP